MMKFDLTPLVQTGGYKVVAKLFISAMPLVILAGFIDYAFSVSLFRGVVIGVLDTVIMFHGMKRALPYVKEPQRVFRLWGVIVFTALCLLAVFLC